MRDVTGPRRAAGSWRPPTAYALPSPGAYQVDVRGLGGAMAAIDATGRIQLTADVGPGIVAGDQVSVAFVGGASQPRPLTCTV